MEKARQHLRIPSVEEVIALNKRHIDETGGEFFPPTNVQYPNGLEWVLSTMEHPFVYDLNPYPTIGHKGALLAWTIIADHCFYDGNKRTAMSLLDIFIDVNGHRFRTTPDELYQFALDIYDYRSTGLTRKVFCDLIASRTYPKGWWGMDMWGE